MQFASVRNKLLIAIAAIAALAVVVAIILLTRLAPVSADSQVREFEVQRGESVSQIAQRLEEGNLIRSIASFRALAVAKRLHRRLIPGRYYFSENMSASEILSILRTGPHQVMRATIPEGMSVFEVDGILSGRGILEAGQLIDYSKQRNIEGRLFPDTYEFYTNSSPKVVAEKMLENFQAKALSLLEADRANLEENLTLASILEKEVPDPQDQRLVAGILKKRIEAGIPLQVDASICYIKKTRPAGSSSSCYPLSPLDFDLDSPYNTYLYRGWPPGPIGSPGVSAISAALQPESSPYWFYLSDPDTRKTIFSRTFEEHNNNREKFLKT